MTHMCCTEEMRMESVFFQVVCLSLEDEHELLDEIIRA